MKYRETLVTVDAVKIASVSDKSNPDLSLNVTTDDGQSRVATLHMLRRFQGARVAPGDYWVTEASGRTSLTPKDAFEQMYEPST